jgi:hypothetical protein
VSSAEFAASLHGHEELLVSSREVGLVRAVRSWYVVEPPETIYLFTTSFALRAARWRRDPWVRLAVPGNGPSLEGTVQFLREDELTPGLVQSVLERWWMWGATTEEGLRRMLRDGSHVLLRVLPLKTD